MQRQEKELLCLTLFFLAYGAFYGLLDFAIWQTRGRKQEETIHNLNLTMQEQQLHFLFSPLLLG